MTKVQSGRGISFHRQDDTIQIQIAMNERLQQVASHFDLKGTVAGIAPLGNGLINDTYIIRTGGTGPDYVLQRINHNIFRDVALMQDNIWRVTSHIRHKLEAAGEKDMDRKVLTMVKNTDGSLYYFDGKDYWRVTVFIPNTETISRVSPETARLTGLAFGQYHKMLSDLEGEPLGESIPDFHNTPFRIQQLRDAVRADRVGRLAGVQDIVDELLGRAEEMSLPQALCAEGKLVKRVVHCDTKVDNMLFDANDHSFLCVIDLDTTMPGFVLSDFGDFIRTAGNTAAEDEPDTRKIDLNVPVFEAFAEGYIESTRNFLSPLEISLLPYGAMMMTYMQTVRFLADYLDGDSYYKIGFPEHNLQRTRAQLTLLHHLTERKNEMDNYINSLL